MYHEYVLYILLKAQVASQGQLLIIDIAYNALLYPIDTWLDIFNLILMCVYSKELHFKTSPYDTPSPLIVFKPVLEGIHLLLSGERPCANVPQHPPPQNSWWGGACFHSGAEPVQAPVQIQKREVDEIFNLKEIQRGSETTYQGSKKYLFNATLVTLDVT